jgi:hypothetical protein
MKLLLVTLVEEYHDEVMALLKKAGINNYSSSDIGGHKDAPTLLKAAGWFPSEKSDTDSHLFFSFTTDEKIDVLFELLQEFNENLETNNPVKAVVLPIERFI